MSSLLPSAPSAVSDVGLMVSAAANTWMVLRSLGGDHADEFLLHLTVSDILLDLHLPLFAVGVSIVEPAYLWAWLRLNLVVGLALALVPVLVLARGLAVAAVDDCRRPEGGGRMGGDEGGASQMGRGCITEGGGTRYVREVDRVGVSGMFCQAEKYGIGVSNRVGEKLPIDIEEKTDTHEFKSKSSETGVTMDIDLSEQVRDTRSGQLGVVLPVGVAAFVRRHAYLVLAAAAALVPVIFDGGDVSADSLPPLPPSTFPSLSVMLHSSEATFASNPVLSIWALAAESLLSALNFPLSVLCALPAVVFVLLKQDVADLAEDRDERYRRSNKRKERLLLFALCLIYFCIFVYDLLLLNDWLDSSQSNSKGDSAHSAHDQDSASLYQESTHYPTEEEGWEVTGTWPGPVTKSSWLSSDVLWLSYAFRPWTRVVTAVSRVMVAVASESVVRLRSRKEAPVWQP